jgi:hypothetical protein
MDPTISGNIATKDDVETNWGRTAKVRPSLVFVPPELLNRALVICRKVIILDVKETDALQIFALAAAMLALGIVYRLIRDSDQRLVNTA